jgi:hypothetical protein
MRRIADYREQGSIAHGTSSLSENQPNLSTSIVFCPGKVGISRQATGHLNSWASVFGMSAFYFVTSVWASLKIFNYLAS